MDLQIDYSNVLRSFVQEKISFAVVGGFAAVAYGVVRLTVDLDLALIVKKSNLEKTWDLLERLGFKVSQPLSRADFTNPARLEEISRTKNAKAISFYHQKEPYLVVDLMIDREFQFHPGDLEKISLFGVQCPVLSLNKLIELKKEAGRDKDLEDLRELEKNLTKK